MGRSSTCFKKKQGTTRIPYRDQLMPLPLGAILLDIDINWKFATIDPKSKGMILNLFIKTGNHMETIL